jgi:hypothetical protein
MVRSVSPASEIVLRAQLSSSRADQGGTEEGTPRPETLVARDNGRSATGPLAVMTGCYTTGLCGR